MTACAENIFDACGGHKSPPLPEPQEFVDRLHEEKAHVQIVMTLDKWLRACKFQKASSLDVGIGQHVQTNEPFFYYCWEGLTMIVATIRNAEILIWLHNPGDKQLDLDRDPPHKTYMHTTGKK